MTSPPWWCDFSHLPSLPAPFQMVFSFRSTVTAVHGPAWLVCASSPPFIQPSTASFPFLESPSGLFHVVQEVRLRSDYKEIILLKKKREKHSRPSVVVIVMLRGPAWNWGSVEDPRWGLWCLIAAAWTCLCLAPTAQGWSGGRRGKVPCRRKEIPLFLHVSDQRVVIIKSRKCFQHSAFFHSSVVQIPICVDFPSC